MEERKGQKLWKKIISVLLSVIIAFGTFVVLTVGSSRLQDMLGIKSMLSAYAAEIVDTKGAASVNEEAMLADNHLIDLENIDGSNTVYLFSEPISYTDENGNLKTKDISVKKQTDKDLESEGYEYTNGQNDYRINFSKASDRGVLVQFDGGAYSIVPQGKFEVEGRKGVSEYLGSSFEVFEYENLYGVGTNLKFYPQLNGVKDEIVLNQNINKNAFSFELKTENCYAVLNDDGTVALISNKDESVVQTFTAPFAYDREYVEGDQNNHYINCKYSLEETGNDTYLLTVTVDKAWLESEATVYPVVIDPTTSNISNYKDAGIYSSATSRVIPYGNEATCCFGRTSNTEYGYGRVLNYFSWPDAIKKGAVINSAYIWERETTGRTTTTYVAPCLISEHWVEGSVTWENRPGYYTSTTMAKKNINSKSTDKSNDPYWYKFDIAKAVKYWADGTYHNYGLLFRSSEEDDGNYNWRAFASKQHSTSSYRPYTVINYTNDTTAPTVTSVTGNPTNWTNSSVTLTVNGAADNSGGAGLHTTAYSFSTTKDSYSWQSGKTKTFSSNCTVYVYVRDALENIRLVSTQKITKIDKTKPTTPAVTGAPTEWTNQNYVLTATSTDSQSGIAEYSFSTKADTYAWQTGNTKTYTGNGTVYVYTKDNAGNISAVKTVTISKVDKVKPEKPVVTGNTEGWSNHDVVLTAESTDNLSGVCAYSFSTEPEKYNWQTENSISISEQSKLYVYAKDNAGNISEPCEINLDIDKLSPTGTIGYEKPEDWVREIILTADASDEISGLHEKAYSFSSEEGVYNWQTDNKKTITSNGTVYVYVRDTAENITLLDTVVIDKIDRAAPAISDVDIQNVEDKTVITITASDSQSGIAEYSIDGGETWQSDNVFEIAKDSLNFINVKTKDNLGNITSSLLSKYYDFYTPQLYYENERLGIYNPNPNCQGDIYYKYTTTGSWIKYDKPMVVPEGKKVIFVSFYKKSFVSVSKAIPIDVEYSNKFAYSESKTDFSMRFNSVDFDIVREYTDGKWTYSYDSHLDIDENGALIVAQLPDFSTFTFVKNSRYSYVNESQGYEITVVYDRNDKNIVEYILNYGKINYHYNSNGVFTKISNKYGELFIIERNAICILITDKEDRTTALYVDNGKLTSIVDNDGGTITYDYADDNLIRVTDQAGVILSEYEYTDGKISKSSDKSIFYDTDNRVVEYLNDNGYSTKMVYSGNSVTITTSDNQSSAVSYDVYGNITSSTDGEGEVTTYTYDGNLNLLKVEKSGEVINEYSYNANGTLSSQTDSESTVNYYYDENDNLIETQELFSDRTLKNEYVYYVYDENNNLIIQAKINSGYAPIEYDENWNYDSVIRYTYSDNELVKVEDVNNNTTTSYEYDSWGNVTKTTVESEEDGRVVVTITSNIYDEFGNIAQTDTIVEEDGTTSISKTTNEYDIFDRLLVTNTDGSETSYTYDPAGRTLLVNADGEYYRTVYDNHGRVVQEIDNSEYNPAQDNLPDAYSDKNAGHRYVYSDTNNLIKEINKFGIETDYTYSDIGLLSQKHFDIYDYYYLTDGKCDRIDVSGKTIVKYEYDVTNDSVDLEEGQTVNRTTYADGTFDLKIVDSNGVVHEMYNNDSVYYGVLPTSDSNKLRYGNNDTDIITTISSGESYTSIEKWDYSLVQTQYYKAVVKDDVATIDETHFKKNFQTVINENSIKYTSDSGNVECVYENENTDKLTQTIKRDDTEILASSYIFDEENDKYVKSYGDDLTFFNQYDNDGNIVSDGKNKYAYDKYGQLASVTGEHNSSYTYDNRGNILTKTVDGETTTYEYNSEVWKDQLTKVNDTELTYDANGNMTSYGDTQYTWSYGKRLASVTDGENTYSYKYDENGIRVSKTVNGKITEINTINGLVLSQRSNSDDSSTIYFQYDAKSPLGFVYKDTQYFYITNQNGDIVGITDVDGNIIAEYSYDEWGKLLSIEADSEESKALAELNPLRYRGYYYDNETGYYYLQSRYYDPNLGRFISADSFDYINTKSHCGINAYAYCENNPIKYSDFTGYSATIVAGSVLAALIEALAEMLGIAVTGLIAGVTVGGLMLLAYIISAIVTSLSNVNYTKILTDVKAKEQRGEHYKIAYLNNRGELITLGSKMTFTSALSALGITATTNSISNRYIFKYYDSRVSKHVQTAHSYSNWGIYADTQSAAKALAVVLGYSGKPEVHGDGYYGHYHDADHIIHIWYGSPVHY